MVLDYRVTSVVADVFVCLCSFTSDSVWLWMAAIGGLAWDALTIIEFSTGRVPIVPFCFLKAFRQVWYCLGMTLLMEEANVQVSAFQFANLYAILCSLSCFKTPAEAALIALSAFVPHIGQFYQALTVVYAFLAVVCSQAWTLYLTWLALLPWAKFNWWIEIPLMIVVLPILAKRWSTQSDFFIKEKWFFGNGMKPAWMMPRLETAIIMGEDTVASSRLQTLKSLKKLVLYNQTVSEVRLVNLTKLFMEHCRLIDSKCLSNLVGLQNLTLRSVAGVKIGKPIGQFRNLRKLHVVQCKLRKVCPFKNPVLETLLIERNKLTALELDCPKLTFLDASYNKLAKLDTRKCPQLKYLFAYNNKLTRLDLRGNKLLESLVAQSNPFIRVVGLDHPGMILIGLSLPLYVGKLGPNIVNLDGLNLASRVFSMDRYDMFYSGVTELATINSSRKYKTLL